MQTRRNFLRQSATTAGALTFLAPACSKSQPPAQQTASEATGPADLVMIKWQGKAESEEAIKAVATRLVEKAIADLGGLARFVPKGATVWLKPNINFHRTPEFAANTNPDVVATVARLCLEAGAGKVRVGDHSAFGSDKSYPMSGIELAVKAVGAEVVYLDETKFREFAVKGKVLDKWRLCPEMMEADVLINLPVAKNHPLPKVSGCIKNLMGMAGGDRSQWHDNLPDFLSDLYAFVKPKLNIVDAVRVITAGPPRGGNLDDVKFTGAVAAGTDAVALDAWAAELLGHRAEDIPVIAAAAARGLGRIDYRQLNSRESTIA